MTSSIDDDLLVCNACGTQFDTDDRAELKECYICKVIFFPGRVKI